MRFFSVGDLDALTIAQRPTPPVLAQALLGGYFGYLTLGSNNGGCYLI